MPTAGAQAVGARSAEDHYHAAARLYVQGERVRAEAEAVEGLRRDPDHRRLRALLERIRAQSPEGAGTAGAQGTGSGPDTSPGGPGGEQDEGAGAPSDEAANDREDAGATPTAANGPTGTPSPHGAPGMSRDDAERLLRAVEAEEQRVLQALRERRTSRRTTYPDW